MNAAEIRRLLVEELGNVAPEGDPAGLDPDVDLREALDIDSMDFLNLVMALHRRLGIDIPERDYGRLRTLREAVEYLAGKGV